MIDLERIIFMAIKAGAVITISEDYVTIVPEKTQEEAKAGPKSAKTQDPKKQGALKELDMGKVRALRNAGWTFNKIGDEMGVSSQTIANRLKAEDDSM